MKVATCQKEVPACLSPGGDHPIAVGTKVAYRRVVYDIPSGEHYLLLHDGRSRVPSIFFELPTDESH